LDFGLIAYKELKVTGSLGQKWTAWRRGLTLLGQGQVDTESLVTHVLPLTRWREAFQLFEEKKGLKIVLQPVD
jgi:threonine dehydrogenase-like Zn-dependent dehydrogenase